eukprot:847447-Pyramimonas_sp.AAC.1
MLEVSIRWSSGPTISATDNEEVCRVWWARAYEKPVGANADIWRAIKKHLVQRPCSEIVVLKVPSHVEAQCIVELGVPSWMIAGNVCVDTLAGIAAAEARLPECQRAQVLRVENDARLVRM